MTAIVTRRLESADLGLRVRWFNSPAVFGQMVIDYPLSEAATAQWFQKNAMNSARRDFSFVDTDEKDGRLVAMGGLTDIDSVHGHAELYIVVDPASFGKGFGSAGVRWLCNYGFLQLNLSKIYLYTMAANLDARRLYERLGFVAEGVLRKHTRHLGRFVDRHVHGLLREEWEALPWRAEAPLPLHLT